MTLSEIVRQNFQAARELVARQANRHARAHLLVAMDEVLRQALDARQAPAEPDCEPDCRLCSGEACETHGTDPCECATDERHQRQAPAEQCIGPFGNAFDCPVHDPRKRQRNG